VFTISQNFHLAFRQLTHRSLYFETHKSTSRIAEKLCLFTITLRKSSHATITAVVNRGLCTISPAGADEQIASKNGGVCNACFDLFSTNTITLATM